LVENAFLLLRKKLQFSLKQVISKQEIFIEKRNLPAVYIKVLKIEFTPSIRFFLEALV